jgi:hypothetical protein
MGAARTCASICFGSKYCHFVSVALRPPSRSVQFDQSRETKKKLQQRTNTNKGNKRKNRIISLSCVGWEGGSYRAWAKIASHGETRYVIKSFDKPILSPAPFHSDPVVYTLPTLDLFRHPKVLTISRRSTHGKSKISNKTQGGGLDPLALQQKKQGNQSDRGTRRSGVGHPWTHENRPASGESKTSNGQFNTTLFTFSPFYLRDVKASVNNAS